MEKRVSKKHAKQLHELSPSSVLLKFCLPKRALGGGSSKAFFLMIFKLLAALGAKWLLEFFQDPKMALTAAPRGPRGHPRTQFFRISNQFLTDILTTRRQNTHSNDHKLEMARWRVMRAGHWILSELRTRMSFFF